MSFQVAFHHGGHFVRQKTGNRWLYKGGTMEYFVVEDVDRWSYFEATGTLREQLDINIEEKTIWYKSDSPGSEGGFKQFKNDNDAEEVAKYVMEQRDLRVHLYIEDKKAGKAKAVEDDHDDVEVMAEGADDSSNLDSSSDDEAKEVHFSYSEEERALGLDDGFGDDDGEDDTGTMVVNSASQRRTEVTNEEEYTPDSDEGEYESEELLSSGLDSDVEVEGKSRRSRLVFKRSEFDAKYKFRLGLEFSSLKEFKEVMLEHAILNGRDLKYVKNDRKRTRIACKGENCNFLALCSRVGSTHTYKLKTYNGKHTCYRVFNNKSATSKWVGKVAAERLQSSEKVKISEIIKEVGSRYSTGITVHRAWSGIKMARDQIEGDALKQYTLLRSYCAELKLASPGNSCSLEVERIPPTLQPRFGSFYLCMEGSKNGFLKGCRPFIGVDGCHLKTKYGGILLIAVGRDANDQYYPFAFGVVQAETTASWRWFLTQLMDDIGYSNRWVFISDQQKGLMNVFQEMFETTEHRLCVRHLYANFKKKFGGGTAMRKLMMGAAKATHVRYWELQMDEIKKLDPKAWEWLMGVPTNLWCKHAMSFYPKCDVIMNNLAESFNSTILLARDKPILTMFETIRTYCMNWMVRCRTKLGRWPHRTMPKPMMRLNAEVQHCGNWIPYWAGEYEFEVEHLHLKHRFKVDLAKKRCACGFWELVGIPCRHAIAGMNYKGLKPEDYVDDYYSREAYAACYNCTMSTLNGQLLWPRVEGEEVLPPAYKRGVGRPKKLRRREPDEDINVTKLKRSGTSYKCTNCDKYGHNARNCSNPTVPAAAVRKRKPSKKALQRLNEGEVIETTDPAQSIADTTPTEPNQLNADSTPTQVIRARSRTKLQQKRKRNQADGIDGDLTQEAGPSQTSGQPSKNKPKGQQPKGQHTKGQKTKGQQAKGQKPTKQQAKGEEPTEQQDKGQQECSL